MSRAGLSSAQQLREIWRSFPIPPWISFFSRVCQCWWISFVEHTENLPSQISDPAAPSHSQQAEEELCAGEMFHPGGMSSWGQWGIELRIKSSGTFKLRFLCLIFVLWCITQTHCCHKFWKREIFKDSSNSDNSMILWNSWVQKHILSGKQTCLPLRSLKPPFILFDTHHPARKTGFIFEIPN